MLHKSIENTWETQQKAQAERDYRVAEQERLKSQEQNELQMKRKQTIDEVLKHLSLKNLPFRGNTPFSIYEDVIYRAPIEILMPLLDQLYLDADMISEQIALRYTQVSISQKRPIKFGKRP